MIEIVHLKRGHRSFAAVFGLDRDEFFTIKQYRARYAAGLVKPHYPLPAMHFRGRYDCLPNALVEHEEREWDHPATCKCEVCRYWGA